MSTSMIEMRNAVDAAHREKDRIVSRSDALCVELSTINAQLKQTLPRSLFDELTAQQVKLKQDIANIRTMLLDAKSNLREADETYFLEKMSRREDPERQQATEDQHKDEVRAFRALLLQAATIFHREISHGFKFSMADTATIDRIARVAHGDDPKGR